METPSITRDESHAESHQIVLDLAGAILAFANSRCKEPRLISAALNLAHGANLTRS
jgi:hypothetical protein